MRLAIGTFTDGFMGGTAGEGIYLFELDPVDLSRRGGQILRGLESPSFIVRHPRLSVLYAAERRWSAQNTADGALTTMSINTSEGTLAISDRRRTEGAFTAHVQVSPDGALVAVANPLGPSICIFGTDSAGLPTNNVHFSFTGAGAKPRQSAPWPHSCWFDPTGRRMFVCDLGLDIVSIYDITGGPGLVAPAAFAKAQVCSGAGARHLAITPDGRFCFVANELDGTICAFTIDDERGTLAIVQTICAGPRGPAHPCQPAEILVSPEGNHLYVTLRGSETVGVFAIEPDSGRLKLADHVPCRGNTPRHIAFSPDGTLAVICNQLSDRVEIFTRSTDGALHFTGKGLDVPSPSCAAFL